MNSLPNSPGNLLREAIRRWHLVIVLVSMLAIVPLIAGVGDDRVALLQAAWGASIVLYAAYTLLRLPDSLIYEIANPILPLLIAYLAFGLVSMLGVLAVGSGIVLLAWLAFPEEAGRSGTEVLQSFARALREMVPLGAGLLAGALLYKVVGGRLPLYGLRGADLVPLGVLVLTSFTVRIGLQLLVPETYGMLPLRLTLNEFVIGALVEGMLGAMATLLTAAVLDAGGVYLMLTFWLLIVFGLLTRSVELSRRALGRRIGELITLNIVGEALTAVTSLEELFEAIYVQVSRLLGAPTFYITLVDDQGNLTFPLVYRLGTRMEWPTRPPLNGPTEYILRHCRPLLSLGEFGVLVRSLGLQAAPINQPCRSFLGVPIHSGGEVLGALVVQHPARVRAFTLADQHLLEVIAVQAAIALRNVRLLADSRRLADGLVAINQVSNVINASLETQTILRHICDVSLKLSGASAGAIFLRSREHLRFEPVYTIHLNLAGKTYLEAMIAEEGGEARWLDLITHPRPQTLLDLAGDERTRWLQPLVDAESFTSLTITPFVSARSLLNEQTLSPSRDLIGFQVIFYRGVSLPDQNQVNLLEMLGNQAAIAIENAGLFEETQNAVKRLAYLAEATRIFTDSLDLQNVSQSVVDWVVNALDVDSATLALFNLAQDSLTIQAHARGYDAPLNVAMPDLGVSLDAVPELVGILHGRWSRLFHVTDTDLSEPLHQMLRQARLHTLILTPLLVREEAIGLLGLGLGHGHSRVVSASDINLAEAIASQSATAIQNAQLHRSTEAALSERVMEMNALENLLGDISAATDVETVVQDVLAAAYTVTRADRLGCVLRRAHERVILYWSYGVEADALQAQEMSLPVPGLIGRALESGQPVNVADTDQQPAFWLPEGAGDFRSELCVPILHEGRSLGVLTVESRVAGNFTQAHLRFLENLAGHAAIALVRVNLFASNRRQIDTLDALRLFSMDLLETDAVSDVLDRVVTQARSLVDALNVHLYYYDPASDQLTFATSLWRDGRRNVEVAPPSATGLTRQAFREGGPVVSDRFHHIPGIDTRLIGTFPMRRGGQTVGVLNVAVDDPEQLGEDEVRALELLTYQAAIAIERARLSESRQRQIDLLERLRSLSVELLDVPTQERVVEAVCLTALTMSGSDDVHLYCYDDALGTLTFAGSLWKDGQRNVEYAPPRPDGVSYQAVRSGKRAVIEDVLSEFGDSSPVEMVMSLPLKHGGQVVGVLNLAGSRDTLQDTQMLSALELLANQAAAALRNVRLYEEVRDGRDRMQAIFNTVRDGLALIDYQGRLVQVNPAAERYAGFPLSSMLGRPMLRIGILMGRVNDAYSLDGLRSVWQQIREDPLRSTLRDLQIEIDGRLCFLEEETVPVLDEAGVPIGRLLIWRDVTDDKILEETRSELTNTIVHDLRSPLTALKGGLSVIRELLPYPEENDAVLEMLAIAEGSTDNLLKLVESMLEVARLQARGVPLQLEKVAIDEPVQQAIQLLEVLAREAEVRLVLDLDENLPPLRIDTIKIRRVLTNLLDNALRFTPNGSQITISAERPPDEDYVLVKVVDSGPGIPAELRERIFERFATGLTGLPRRGGRGLGLGLTFCKLAVEAHGGRIWVEDGLNGGAAFCFTLPISAETSMMQTSLPG